MNTNFTVNSCGIYLLKGGIRKTSTGNYLSGTYMDISCQPGYTLFGWHRFYCNWNATWLPTNNMWLEQFRDWPYCERNFTKMIIKLIEIALKLLIFKTIISLRLDSRQ